MYVCEGDVCGSCDVKHRKLSAAFRCLRRHQAAIERHNTRGAYSDRWIRHVDGSRLTADELDELHRMQDEADAERKGWLA